MALIFTGLDFLDQVRNPKASVRLRWAAFKNSLSSSAYLKSKGLDTAEAFFKKDFKSILNICIEYLEYLNKRDSSKEKPPLIILKEVLEVLNSLDTLFEFALDGEKVKVVERRQKDMLDLLLNLFVHSVRNDCRVRGFSLLVKYLMALYRSNIDPSKVRVWSGAVGVYSGVRLRVPTHNGRWCNSQSPAAQAKPQHEDLGQGNRRKRRHTKRHHANQSLCEVRRDSGRWASTGNDIPSCHRANQQLLATLPISQHL